MTGVIISVVIPTYHREELLDRCLNALVHQDFDPDEYEIIVVDDGCSEVTRRLVDQWAERTQGYRLVASPVTNNRMEIGKPGTTATASTTLIQETIMRLAYLPLVRYIPVTNQHGPAAARNLGWKAAVGEIIAFTDDDCIPQRDWLKRGMEALEGADGASGQVIVPLNQFPTDYELNARGLEVSEFVTANCFYRKHALESVAGFDELFTTAWREDTDLFFSLLERGFTLVPAPAAIVIHPIRPASWGISLRQQRKNMYNALLYKKHPKNYHARLKARTPVLYYAILLALILFAVGLGTRSVSAIQVGLFGWVGLVLAFCARRLQYTSRSIRHISEIVVTSILIPPLAIYWRIRGALRYRVLFF